MQEPSNSGSWTRHFVHRTARLRTTWKFRVGFVVFIVLVAWLTSGWWTVAVARSLVCETNPAPSDAILVENLDADYLLFERATALRRAGFASRVIVPIKMDGDQPNMVAIGTAKLMASIARVGEFDIVPMHEVEPISLNAARDVLRFVTRERIRSVLVVAPYFRSRRSSLIYEATLGRAGIRVTCEPVRGLQTDNTWPLTLHGIQNVLEQWLKLQYYKLYILPFRAGA